MTQSYRTAGRAAAASGITGIFTFAALITAVTVRNSQGMDGLATVLFRTHDAGAVIQFVLMLPVAFALYQLTQRGSAGISKVSLNTGRASLSFTVVLLLLIFPKAVSDPMYMVPQGVFGGWLILVCLHTRSVLPRGLKWFGIVVGFGLALVGLFPLGYALFVDKVILQIPAAPDAVIEKIPSDTVANTILHYILFAGTFTGVITLPVWTILFGRHLLRGNK